VLFVPIYMPLSWAGVTLSVGFFGWTVARRHGALAGALAAALLAGVGLPF